MLRLTRRRNQVLCTLGAAAAAVLTAGFSATAAADVPSRAVREVAGDKKPTGRLEGRIKLPDRKVKLPDFASEALKAAEATGAFDKKIPEVRLKSISLLAGGAKDPIAEAELDKEGKFSFENVPAGVVRLQPNFEVVSPEIDAALRNFSLGQSFTPYTTVQAGKTTEVAFFGRGRPVTGRIVLPEGIKPGDASVRLTMVDPPSRAMHGRNLDRPRPTPLAVAFYAVRPDRELESELDADGRFRIKGVPEGTYRLQVTIRGPNAGERVWFTGYAAGQSEWVKNGIFSAPLMKDGTSEVPLDLGAPQFERVPKPG